MLICTYEYLKKAAFYETITASNSFHTEYKSHVSTDFFERFNELEDDMNKSLHRLAIESDDNVHTPVMDIMYKKTSALLMLSNVCIFWLLNTVLIARFLKLSANLMKLWKWTFWTRRVRYRMLIQCWIN